MPSAKPRPRSAKKPTTARRPATRAKAAKRAKRAPSAKAPGSAKPASGAGKAGRKPVLLSGGNPQIAKGEGDAPVQAYIAALSGWKRDLVRRVDALVEREVPGVRKAVKWNSPFYGVADQGWFLSVHVFTDYVKATFFRGTSLRPVPPGGKHPDGRWVNITPGDLDEAQLAKWVRQAAAIPGWGGK